MNDKVNKIDMIPNTGNFWIVFRQVSGYMTSEFFADKAEMEKHIFKLEYENQKYRLVSATNLNVKIKLEYDYKSVTRDCSISQPLYGAADDNGKHF